MPENLKSDAIITLGSIAGVIQATGLNIITETYAFDRIKELVETYNTKVDAEIKALAADIPF